MNQIDRKEEKQQKKRRRIAKAGAWSLGIGVGLYLVKMIAPIFIMPEPSVQAFFSGASLALILYGIIQLIGVAFVARHASKIDLVMTYLVMPVMLLKLIADYST